jgi:hypothetical protein
MFCLLGVYALFSLKCNFDIFWNVKKIQTKNSCVHLPILSVHKVFASKINLSFGLCKNTKFSAKDKAFVRLVLSFLHRP